MFSLKTIFFSTGLLVLLLAGVSLPGMFIPTLFQPPSQTPNATPSAWRIEAESLPLPPDVGTPARDTLAPITVENANQLSSLSTWSPLPQEGDPDWQLGPIVFNPRSTLLTRLKTGHIFFGMGIWHLWDVTSPFAPTDLDTIPGTGYDYTFWTYADTVFTDTGYARASMSVEFSNAAQDWGGSATPSTRWITYQQSGGPEIIVQQDYHAQQYSPQVWLKLSADGRRLMVYSSGRLYVWDASQQRILAEISLGGPPYLVGFSPDNRYIVTIENEAFVVRRIEPGELVQVLNIPGARGQLPVPQFMPNDTALFVTTVGREVEVWDLDTQTLVHTVMVPCVSIRQIAFNPDGTLLAISVECSTTAGHEPSEILLWDARTMTELAALSATIDISALAFSPDGYLLAVGDAAQTELWGIQMK